nr:GDP-mannose 4,6-dehydratase [Verrucomicrobium spinosum]
MKRALITGITGQDGTYLAEHLLSLGYEVHGLVRQTNLESLEGGRTGGGLSQCLLHAISLDSFPGLHRLIKKYKFDECYHLASVSFVGEHLADGFHTMFATSVAPISCSPPFRICNRTAGSTLRGAVRCLVGPQRLPSRSKRHFFRAILTVSAR